MPPSLRFWIRTLRGTITPAERIAQLLFDEWTMPSDDDPVLAMVHKHTGCDGQHALWLGITYNVACNYLCFALKVEGSSVFREARDLYTGLIQVRLKHPADIQMAGDAFADAYDLLAELLQMALHGEVCYRWSRRSLQAALGIEVSDYAVLGAWAESCASQYAHTRKVFDEHLGPLAKEA